jgi:hypothetical protein
MRVDDRKEAMDRVEGQTGNQGRDDMLQRVSMAALQAGLALMAMVSLHPYLLWEGQKPAYGIATFIILASLGVSFRRLSFTRQRLVLSIAFSLFLIYLSCLPKVHGGFTRWFLLIPFTVALIHLRSEHLRTVFNLFHWIFALSLVPGIALWLWAISGLPLELRFMTPPVEITQRGVTEYLELPGAIFMLTNGIVLPNGGVLFRLCGMYDEPGTVGTIAALCLAATRFRIGHVKGAISFAAGLMSLSVAFSILTTLGLLATALHAKRPYLLAAALLSLGTGLLPLSGFKFADPPPSNLTILSYPSAQAAAGGEGTASRERFEPYPTWRLRNSEGLDNRAQPWMRRLLTDYAAAPVPSILFGIASDASLVLGWGSSVWYRVLTDFGIVGLAWLMFLFSYPLLVLWRERRLDAPVMIASALFLMSFYQRPIIWLPAQFLIYLAGVFAAWPRAATAQAQSVTPARPAEDGRVV